MEAVLLFLQELGFTHSTIAMPHIINVSKTRGSAECGYLYFDKDLAIHLRYEPANPEAYPADWETVYAEYEDPAMLDIIEHTYKSKH